MRYVLALALFFAAPSTTAQTFILEQTRGGGGPTEDDARGIALAADGSRYVIGTFENTATFDGISISSIGGSDLFLVKYGPTGEVLWARRGGSNASDFGAAVEVAPDGSVYVIGSFNGNATFSGGDNPDVLLLSSGGFDVYLLKYDPNGTIQWARRAGGMEADIGRDLAVDTSGNVYLAGSFRATGTFGGTMLTSAGETDTFLAKYAPDGTVLWAQRGGGEALDIAYGIAVADDGTAHLSGTFEGIVQFGSLPGQSLGGSDVFVIQYSSSGEAVWATRIGSGGNEFTRSSGIGLGMNGSVFVHGTFSSTLTIGEDVLMSAGSTDIFLAKLNSNGEAIWGRRGGGEGEDAAAALNVFGNGILLTGYVEGEGSFGNIDFDTQGRDAYFAVFDITGNLFTVKVFGGAGSDVGNAIASDLASSTFALAGRFEDTATFDTLTLTSNGESDGYMVAGRYGVVDVEPGAGTPSANTLGAAYPNPFSQITTLTLDLAQAQNVTIELFDVLGRRVATVYDGPLAMGSHRVMVEAAGLPTGLYVVRAEGETFRFARRVTLVR